MRDPRNFVPRDKHDLDRVRALVEVGYPRIALVLDEIFAWTFDANWPVAPPLAEYLCALGGPIIGSVKAILAGDGEQAKWFWLGYMRMYMARDLVAQAFADELRRLATCPTAPERREEIDLQAAETLAWLDEETP